MNKRLINKNESGVVKIEEFLKQTQEIKGRESVNRHRKSNPFKLHRTSKTTYVNPFNTLNEEMPKDQLISMKITPEK